MTWRGSPALRGLALLAAALAVALLPGRLPGTVSALFVALYLPGRALCLCTGTSERFGRLLGGLDAIAASLALSPLCLRLASVVLPFDRAHVLGVLSLASFALFVVAHLRSRSAPAPAPSKAPLPVIGIVVLTALLLAPALWIGPTADGGESRVKGWDLNNHLAMAESIAARGLPPVNPFLATGAPFYYHTFFHVLLAAVLLISRTDLHSYALIALLTLLIAAAFLSTVHRVVAEIGGRDRAAVLALPFVSLVGGFDLVPMAGRALLPGEGSVTAAGFFLRHWNVDGWISNRGMLVPSLFADFYWAPHAVAATVVLLLAVSYLRGPEGGLLRIAAAGACLASMAGYNGYIALGGAAALALTGGGDLWRVLARRCEVARALLLRSALAGGLALVLGLPVLDLYLRRDAGPAKFRWVRPGPLLLLQLVLEFGPALLFAVAGAILLRRREVRRAPLAPFVAMGAATLPIVCVVASTGENNDLAMRASMLAWISFAVLGGIALDRLLSGAVAPSAREHAMRVAGLLALSLGALSVAWFAVGAAVAKPVFTPDEVACGRWVRSHVAPGRRVQGSPLRENPDFVYLSGRPAVLSDTWAGRLFYASPEDFSARLDALREAFSSEDSDRACAVLRSLEVAVVVAGPPEERDFPILARPAPRPCLEEVFRRGAYRVLRLN